MAKTKALPPFMRGKMGKSTPPVRAPERTQPRYALGPDATMTAEKPFVGAKKGGKIRRK